MVTIQQRKTYHVSPDISSSPKNDSVSLIDTGSSRNCHHNAQSEQSEESLHGGLLSQELRTGAGLYKASTMMPKRMNLVGLGALPPSESRRSGMAEGRLRWGKEKRADGATQVDVRDPRGSGRYRPLSLDPNVHSLVSDPSLLQRRLGSGRLALEYVVQHRKGTSRFSMFDIRCQCSTGRMA